MDARSASIYPFADAGLSLIMAQGFSVVAAKQECRGRQSSAGARGTSRSSELSSSFPLSPPPQAVPRVPWKTLIMAWRHCKCNTF